MFFQCFPMFFQCFSHVFPIYSINNGGVLASSPTKVDMKCPVLDSAEEKVLAPLTNRGNGHGASVGIQRNGGVLVGGLEHFFPYIGNNNPNWLIFFRGVETTNQRTPKWMCYFMENPNKWWFGGTPIFWKPPSGGYTILEVIFDPSKMDGLRIC